MHIRKICKFNSRKSHYYRHVLMKKHESIDNEKCDVGENQNTHTEKIAKLMMLMVEKNGEIDLLKRNTEMELLKKDIEIIKKDTEIELLKKDVELEKIKNKFMGEKIERYEENAATNRMYIDDMAAIIKFLLKKFENYVPSIGYLTTNLFNHDTCYEKKAIAMDKNHGEEIVKLYLN